MAIRRRGGKGVSQILIKVIVIVMLFAITVLTNYLVLCKPAKYTDLMNGRAGTPIHHIALVAPVTMIGYFLAVFHILG